MRPCIVLDRIQKVGCKKQSGVYTVYSPAHIWVVDLLDLKRAQRMRGNVWGLLWNVVATSARPGGMLWDRGGVVDFWKTCTSDRAWLR